MASISDDIESGEVLLTVASVAIVLYFVMQFAKSIPNAAAAAVDATKQVVKETKQNVQDITQPQNWIGTSGPMTDQETFNVAVWLIGIDGHYQVSPDKTQLWFDNGSYYDNPTNAVYNKDTSRVGTAFIPPDYKVNNAVIPALGQDQGF